MHRRLLWILSVLLVLSVCSPVSAQDVPPLLSHQARLFGADNEPLSGPQQVTFRLYDLADDTGTVLWEETLDVTLENGYYSAVLGQTTALPDDLFNGSTRYLGVTVGDATAIEELSPRLEVTSVAYAIKAGTAENATGALTPESVTLNGGGTVLDADGTVTVGGATIAPDGQISLGAATINTDGSIVVGNTTINPDGSISVAGNPVIGADGAVDSAAFTVTVGAGLSGAGTLADPIVTTDTTLTGLEAAGCSDDQVPQFAAATGWSCQTVAGVDTNTTYEAGSGLTLTGPNNTFSVDFGVAQQAIINSCGAGSAIQTINADGTVTCETDTDTDTTYAAGAGLTLTGTTFDVDAAAIQVRVTGVCAGTDKVTAINADGTVVCDPDVDTDTTYTAGAGIDITGGAISLLDPTDDDTTYTAGNGLTLTGTSFEVDTAVVQSRITGACATNEKIIAVFPDGSVFCEPDIDTDTDTDTNTTYTAGAGLTLSGTVFSADTSALQARVTGSCAAGEKLLGINADGSVTCGADINTDTLGDLACPDDQIARRVAGSWACADAIDFDQVSWPTGFSFLTTNPCPAGFTAIESGYIKLGGSGLTTTASGRTLATPGHRHGRGSLATSSAGSHSHSYNDYYYHDSGNDSSYATPTGDAVGQRLQETRTTGTGGTHTHGLTGTIGNITGSNGDAAIAATGDLEHVLLRLCVR